MKTTIRRDLEFPPAEESTRRMRDPRPTHLNAAAADCTARIQVVQYQIQSTHFASFSIGLGDGRQNYSLQISN